MINYIFKKIIKRIFIVHSINRKLIFKYALASYSEFRKKKSFNSFYIHYSVFSAPQYINLFYLPIYLSIFQLEDKAARLFISDDCTARVRNELIDIISSLRNHSACVSFSP